MKTQLHDKENKNNACPLLSRMAPSWWKRRVGIPGEGPSPSSPSSPGDDDDDDDVHEVPDFLGVARRAVEARVRLENETTTTGEEASKAALMNEWLGELRKEGTGSDIHPRAGVVTDSPSTSTPPPPTRAGSLMSMSPWNKNNKWADT